MELGVMLTHQSPSQRSPLRSSMSEQTMLSLVPLTGHLDQPVIPAAAAPAVWHLPVLHQLGLSFPLTFPIPKMDTMPGRVPRVVGGFVGSKSQRHADKWEQYPLGNLIDQCIRQHQATTPTISHLVMATLFPHEGNVFPCSNTANQGHHAFLRRNAKESLENSVTKDISLNCTEFVGENGMASDNLAGGKQARDTTMLPHVTAVESPDNECNCDTYKKVYPSEPANESSKSSNKCNCPNLVSNESIADELKKCAESLLKAISTGETESNGDTLDVRLTGSYEETTDEGICRCRPGKQAGCTTTTHDDHASNGSSYTSIIESCQRVATTLEDFLFRSFSNKTEDPECLLNTVLPQENKLESLPEIALNLIISPEDKPVVSNSCIINNSKNHLEPSLEDKDESEESTKDGQVDCYAVRFPSGVGQDRTSMEMQLGTAGTPAEGDTAVLGLCMRLLSECSVDSNDSSDFIVFGDGSLDDDQSSEDESEYDEEVEEDEEEIRRKEACRRWCDFYKASPQRCDNRETKVRFASQPEVFVMRVWDHASRRARVGPWEQAARDRERFNNRMLATHAVLAPVFTPQHRHKMAALIQQQQ